MTGVKAQAEALLNGATAPDTWYFQPGWGLQFAPEPGTLGLLVPDDAPAKTGDLLLMEAAPKLARQVIELADEVERLRGALTGVLALYPADMRGRPGEEHLWGFKPEVIKTIDSARAALAGSPS